MPTNDNRFVVWTCAFLAAKLDFKAAKSLSALFKSDLAALAGLKFNLFIILWGEGVEDTTVVEVVEAVGVAVDVAADTGDSDISISFVNLAIMSVEEL